LYGELRTVTKVATRVPVMAPTTSDQKPTPASASVIVTTNATIRFEPSSSRCFTKSIRR
jgi:hypothetical protein